MKVRVFRIVDRSTPGTNRQGDVNIGQHKLKLVDVSPSLDFADAELIIIPACVRLSGNSREHDTGSELFTNRLLDAPGRKPLACLVYDESFSNAECLGQKLLKRWGLHIGNHPSSVARIRSPDFRHYLTEFQLSQGQIFSWQELKEETGRFHLLAGPDDKPGTFAAFAVEQNDTIVYVVPANLVSGSEVALIDSLANAIEAHSSSLLRPSTAPIADSFVFGKEKGLRDSRRSKLKELRALEDGLGEYAAKKDILFLRGNTLANRVPEWLTKYLGIPTRRTEEYIEDFWILNSDGKEAAVCEVKGIDDNVKRRHIGALALHRDQRELPDDYPSILFINTFAAAASEREKGTQGVSALECRNATRRHVLIVRTLDLVRLLDQVEEGVLSATEVREHLLGSVGWLKVTGKGIEVIGE